MNRYEFALELIDRLPEPQEGASAEEIQTYLDAVSKVLTMTGVSQRISMEDALAPLVPEKTIGDPISTPKSFPKKDVWVSRPLPYDPIASILLGAQLTEPCPCKTMRG